MFLSTLLAVSEQATETVKWISVGAVVLLLALVAVFSLFRKQKNEKYDAKRIAFAGMCVASSFVLALVKFKFVAFGGSITIASFVPVLLYAYAYGPASGFAVGLIHGLLNFIESPYILTPATFVLDYLLAFASIGIMGFFGKIKRKENSALPLVLGCVCVFSARFLAHLFSGMIFFMQGAIWDPLPSWAMGNAFLYSFIYQCVYVPADALIATMVLVFLAKTGVLDRLTKLMRR
jgi:thiamine transporter